MATMNLQVQNRNCRILSLNGSWKQLDHRRSSASRFLTKKLLKEDQLTIKEYGLSAMTKSKRKISWFTDMAYGDIQLSYRITNQLFKERSSYQEIIIVQSPTFGRILILDGIVQLTERDEYIYHEIMAHVPFLTHGRVRDTLIIGGGDGGILREVLKHDIDNAILVEIDEHVISTCREFLPFISDGAFDDKRVNVVIGDGLKYLANVKDKYDLIIVDSTDRQGPGQALYTESFYRLCQHRLRPNGILVNQNGVPFLYPNHITLTYRRRRKHFSTTSFFVAPVPSIYGGYFSFGWATNSRQALKVSNAILRRRFFSAKLETKYYTPEMHQACIALPKFLTNCLR